jgi:hypothetical protein
MALGSKWATNQRSIRENRRIDVGKKGEENTEKRGKKVDNGFRLSEFDEQKKDRKNHQILKLEELTDSYIEFLG